MLNQTNHFCHVLRRARKRTNAERANEPAVTRQRHGGGCHVTRGRGECCLSAHTSQPRRAIARALQNVLNHERRITARAAAYSVRRGVQTKCAPGVCAVTRAALIHHIQARARHAVHGGAAVQKRTAALYRAPTYAATRQERAAAAARRAARGSSGARQRCAARRVRAREVSSQV